MPGALLPLVDAAEVARQLGVERQTISTYHARGRMPAPVGRLNGGPVWTREQIQEWIDSRPGQGVGGGRPRKQTG